MAFVEANGHAFVRGQEDDLIAVGDAGSDQLVPCFNSDGVDAVGAHVHELAQFRFFHQPVTCREEHILVGFFQITHGKHRFDGFARL